ncbi:MAG: FGGY family carbohydrate kinase [Anaerolineae bacterium]|nr:FGGY family carbohydrate kinase [Anaerolineae bacterium]
MLYILAIDVGTSALKAVLYQEEGRVVGSSTRRYGYHAEHAGWAEGDPEDWWRALQESVADLARQGLALDSVEALSVTGQMHTGVLLGDGAQVIPPTILWLDRRAARETQELLEELKLPPYQLNSSYTLPKLLWLRRHRPEVLEKARTLLWPKDYLRFRLTGEVCTDLTEPGGAGLLDWETRDWALERLDLVGLPASVLPPIREASAGGGALLPGVARSLGLNPQARTVVGMGDVAALFGAAPPRPGRVTVSLGSSSMVFTPLEAGQRACDPDHRLHVYPFGPYPMLGGVSSTSGSSLVWALEKLCTSRTGGRSFDESIAEALEVEPGAGGLCFLPYLAGERNPYWSDEIRGGFYGLQLAHDHRHLLRAVMEGVAFSLRHLLVIFGEMGVPVDEMALAGGGATTPGWPQIIADACGRDVLVYAGEETVTRVLYALCQEHLGRASLAESLLRTFDAPTVIRWNRESRGAYDEGYRRFRAFAGFAQGQARL